MREQGLRRNFATVVVAPEEIKTKHRRRVCTATEKGPDTANIEIETGSIILWSEGVARFLVVTCIGNAELEAMLPVEVLLHVIPGLQHPVNTRKLKQIFMKEQVVIKSILTLKLVIIMTKIYTKENIS